jgi:hypothetical protein
MFSLLALSWFTLCSGTAVAILLCRMTGIPFYRAEHDDWWQKPLVATTVNVHILAPLLHCSGLWAQLWKPFPVHTLHVMPQVVLSMRYLFLIEAIFYFTHRLLHSVPWLYRRVHSIHHRHTDELVPADTFYIDTVDLFCTIQPLWLPLLLLPELRWPHFIAVYYLYIVGSYLQHRPGTRHALHHRHPYVNYSLLFPLFDVVLGTYLHPFVPVE